MRIPLLIMSVLALASCSEDVTPKQKETRAQDAVSLFAQSCVAADGNAAKVGAWANAHQAQALSADDIKKLPFGLLEMEVQSAWKIEQNGAAYYLSLTPDSCSVKAEKADENTVRNQFTELLKTGGQGVNVELRADNATQTPFPLHQLSYAWRQAGSNTETVLTANTSPSEQLPVQAALYLTHQTYSGAPVLNP